MEKRLGKGNGRGAGMEKRSSFHYRRGKKGGKFFHTRRGKESVPANARGVALLDLLKKGGEKVRGRIN